MTRHRRRRRPRFSLITAVYNVGRYLPNFIDSIDRQTFPLSKVEVIAVDDGSTDDSLAILRAWATRRPELITVLTKENGGQASARNLGMDYATGEWLSFPDPDDLLDSDYLRQVDRFLTRHQQPGMIATNRIILDDATNEQSDSHPLRRLFQRDQLVDIDRFPESFHGSAPAAFLPGDLIDRYQLRFDCRVRPNFEDGHFCSRFLLASSNSLIGFIKSARYLYRKRADRSSTLQTALLDPGRFLAVPRYGYLDALQEGVRLRGEAPEWLQNFILYELSFYFRSEAQMAGAASVARGEVADEFVTTLGEIARMLKPQVIDSFGITRFDSAWREILLHSFTSKNWVTPYVVVRKSDPARKRIQLAYRFVGDPPDEVVLFRGQQVAPCDAKLRTHVYWGRTLIRERLMWVPASGTLRVLLNGEPAEFRADWPARKLTSMRPSQREELLTPQDPPRHSRRDREILRAARSLPVRLRYRGAWVLIDRVHNAGDNAEQLFRYLRRNRRDINAWYVIEKGTPDWERLRKEGYKRVVPYGSLQWKLLMLNCRHLISSHADAHIAQPADILHFGPPSWRFTFLQHGVIWSDLSRWLNTKPIDLFITSTVDEHKSIVADDTPYVFTTYETKMAGLARFDRLRELGARVAPNNRAYVLVCPTWRHWLNQPKKRDAYRPILTQDFLKSRFAQEWIGLLCSERLHAVTERSGLRMIFLAHPNIQPVLPELDLPSYVTALGFDDCDVQQLMAETAIMITDYSSVAFNLAYIERPVVYFQFDADETLGGGHICRKGYFDYNEHGFGPVTASREETIDAVEDVVGAGHIPAPTHLARMRRTFPVRDGRCCERTVAAIEALDRPLA